MKNVKNYAFSVIKFARTYATSKENSVLKNKKTKAQNARLKIEDKWKEIS